jgi:predicted nucleic acid-binding Zn ribbon protein
MALGVSPAPMQHTRQEMKLAGADLEKVVARSLRRAPAAQAPLLAWPLACGSTVAERTYAIEFKEGVLFVEVPDARWRTELQTLAARYLAAINRYVAENVKRIEFVVVRVHPPIRVADKVVRARH